MANDDIEHWGSAPGPRAAVIVGETSEREPVQLMHRSAERALQSLITATGSHVTLGTPEPLYEECLAMQGPAPEEIHVTDEMIAVGAERLAAECIAEFGSTWNVDVARRVAVACYRAMAAVAPVELYGPNERRLEDEIASLKSALALQDQIYADRPGTLFGARQKIAEERDAALARIAALEAENAEFRAAAPYRDDLAQAYCELELRLGDVLRHSADRIAALEAKLATFGPVTPADLPDPPRRADGTLAPVAKPWTPPKAHDPSRRIGG